MDSSGRVIVIAAIGVKMQNLANGLLKVEKSCGPSAQLAFQAALYRENSFPMKDSMNYGTASKFKSRKVLDFT